MVDIVNSTRTVIGQAACEVLPPLVAALKLSVGNFLEGKMRHFEEEKNKNSYYLYIVQKPVFFFLCL